VPSFAWQRPDQPRTEMRCRDCGLLTLKLSTLLESWARKVDYYQLCSPVGSIDLAELAHSSRLVVGSTTGLLGVAVAARLLGGRAIRQVSAIVMN
jgi:hypothetical protein